MTENATARVPWYRPMLPRSRDEPHRASTPLELLFDLCFVVAVSRAGAALEEKIGHGHVGAGAVAYCMVFFAIWWAWMNFTWFASAYDTDDVPYRLGVMVQIAGSLVLAAGVTPAFDAEHGNFKLLVIGYVLMRLAIVGNWIRAGRADAERRTTAYRYAICIVLAQLGWIGRLWLPDDLGVASFVVLALVELAIPATAERSGVTRYHPAHIAERYGLFTTIVLGESVVAVVITIEAAVAQAEHRGTLITTAVAGLCILFTMWWLYFDKPADGMLDTLRSSLIWGYGHYLIFSSVAAVGAGLDVLVEHDLGEAEVSARVAGAAVAIPVAIYLMVVWARHLRHRHTPLASACFPVCAGLVLLAAMLGVAVYAVAVLLLALVTVTVITSRAAADRTAARGRPDRPAAVR